MQRAKKLTGFSLLLGCVAGLGIVGCEAAANDRTSQKEPAIKVGAAGHVAQIVRATWRDGTVITPDVERYCDYSRLELVRQIAAAGDVAARLKIADAYLAELAEMRQMLWDRRKVDANRLDFNRMDEALAEGRVLLLRIRAGAMIGEDILQDAAGSAEAAVDRLEAATWVGAAHATLKSIRQWERITAFTPEFQLHKCAAIERLAAAEMIAGFDEYDRQDALVEELAALDLVQERLHGIREMHPISNFEIQYAILNETLARAEWFMALSKVDMNGKRDAALKLRTLEKSFLAELKIASSEYLTNAYGLELRLRLLERIAQREILQAESDADKAAARERLLSAARAIRDGEGKAWGEAGVEHWMILAALGE